MGVILQHLGPKQRIRARLLFLAGVEGKPGILTDTLWPERGKKQGEVEKCCPNQKKKGGGGSAAGKPPG